MPDRPRKTPKKTAVCRRPCPSPSWRCLIAGLPSFAAAWSRSRSGDRPREGNWLGGCCCLVYLLLKTKQNSIRSQLAQQTAAKRARGVLFVSEASPLVHFHPLRDVGNRVVQSSDVGQSCLDLQLNPLALNPLVQLDPVCYGLWSQTTHATWMKKPKLLWLSWESLQILPVKESRAGATGNSARLQWTLTWIVWEGNPGARISDSRNTKHLRPDQSSKSFDSSTHGQILISKQFDILSYCVYCKGV